MPSPFPGMDPFLESPHIWPDVHHELISQIRGELNPALGPKYVARVELRVYNAGDDESAIELMIPDVRVEEAHKNGPRKAKPSNGSRVALAEPEISPHLLDEIKEAYLEIRHRESGALVTIIEVLSPSNKVRGSRGRESLMEKRRATIASAVHWVEIDLLRAGSPTVGLVQPSDYRIIMYRAKVRSGRYWRFNLRDTMPAFGIPLRGNDPDVALDLGAAFKSAYDHAAYERSIDYRREPAPPLSAADRKWADRLLRGHGLR
jgi:hypothetical protein